MNTVFSDEQLMQDCLTGNGDSFGQIYDRYVHKIYDFLFFRTSDQSLSEDLCSQTFLKAYEKRSQFKVAKGKVSTWIYQIARHTLIDHLRTHHPSADLDEHLDLPAPDDLTTAVHRQLESERVQAALRHLKPRSREIIILRLWQDKSYDEIAQILDLSAANCKVIFSRALVELRPYLPLPMWLLFFWSSR